MPTYTTKGIPLALGNEYDTRANENASRQAISDNLGSQTQADRPFFLKSTAYVPGGTPRIDVTLGMGRANFLGTLVATALDTVVPISSPTPTTTYYLYVNASSAFVVNTTGVPIAGHVRIHRLTTGADVTTNVYTLVDERGELPGAAARVVQDNLETREAAMTGLAYGSAVPATLNYLKGNLGAIAFNAGASFAGGVSAIVATNQAAVNGSFDAQDSTSLAAGVGGRVTFSGIYTGSTQAAFAAIAGRKANATNANLQGYLSFQVRGAASTAFTEVGTWDAAGLLNVNGALALTIGAQAVTFTHAASAPRTITAPDATGTLDLIGVAQTISGVKTHSAQIAASGAPDIGATGSRFGTGWFTALNTSGTITITAAAGKIVPGATSLSHRNNADNADNILIADSGATTFRAGLSGITTLSMSGDLTMTGATASIIPGATSWGLRNNANNADNIRVTDAGAVTFRNTVGGITTLTATTLAGTLSTAAQASVTSLGTLTGLAVSGTSTFTGTTQVRTGNTFSVWDSANAKNVALSHDATNATIGISSGRALYTVVTGGDHSFYIQGVQQLAIAAAGQTALVTDAATATVTYTTVIGHESSGTPAASYGTGLKFQGKSSTTSAQDMATIESVWTTATHASRTSDLVIQTVNSATLGSRWRFKGGGDLQYDISAVGIYANTADAADSFKITLSGGGGSGGAGNNTRGGYVTVHGNENAATGSVFIAAGNVTGGVILFDVGGATKLTLDKAGNLGLGVTPSAWNSAHSGMQSGGYGYLGGRASGLGIVSEIGVNSYATGTDTWAAIATGLASQIQFSGSDIIFRGAASVSAGAAQTMTTLAQILSNGQIMATYANSGAPTFSITGDTDTGLSFGGANQPEMMAGGTRLVWWSSASSHYAPVSDNTMHNGNASYRWIDIWAVSGVVTVSNARYKRILENLDPSQALEVLMSTRFFQYTFKPSPGTNPADLAWQRSHWGFDAADNKWAAPDLETTNPMSVACYIGGALQGLVFQTRNALAVLRVETVEQPYIVPASALPEGPDATWAPRVVEQLGTLMETREFSGRENQRAALPVLEAPSYYDGRPITVRVKWAAVEGNGAVAPAGKTVAFRLRARVTNSGAPLAGALVTVAEATGGSGETVLSWGQSVPAPQAGDTLQLELERVVRGEPGAPLGTLPLPVRVRSLALNFA